MYTYARFCYFRWSPPELDAAEQRSLANVVRSYGVGTLVHRFLGLSTRELPDGGFQAGTFFETHGPGLVYVAFIACGFLFLDWNAPLPEKDSPANLLPLIVAVGWLGAIIFYGSMFIAACRYASWVSRIARRFKPEPTDFYVHPDSPAPIKAGLRQQKNDAVVDAHISRVVECAGCGQRLRLPANAGRLHVRCPKCGSEWETDI
jgi:hypothetical protein